eukprot:scaffold3451_cov109-Cylindrotheca_fusiformis.AAC.3
MLYQCSIRSSSVLLAPASSVAVYDGFNILTLDKPFSGFLKTENETTSWTLPLDRASFELSTFFPKSGSLDIFSYRSRQMKRSRSSEFWADVARMPSENSPYLFSKSFT